MPEGDQQAPAQVGGQQAETTPPTNQPQPPWAKSGEEFNAERAWTLIQNLTSERDGLKSEKSQLQQGQSALAAQVAEALGIKQEKGSGPDDLVSSLQRKVAEIETDRDVERLARVHGLSDSLDIEALRAVPDPDKRAQVAERLGKASPKAPQPDPSQGVKPPAPKPDPGKGIPRLAAAYAESEAKH